MTEDVVYKILLLGDTSVGKTCFLLRYTDKIFEESHISTIGLDYRLKSMTLKSGKNIKLQIWDTSGQERFRAITKNYYKQAHGILLMYDITNDKTYSNIQKWITQIKEETSSNIVVFIIGNKIDLEKERVISYDDGKNLAEQYQYPFFEASSKTAVNINEIFENIAEKVDEQFSKVVRKSSTIKKNKVYKAKNRCC